MKSVPIISLSPLKMCIRFLACMFLFWIPMHMFMAWLNPTKSARLLTQAKVKSSVIKVNLLPLLFFPIWHLFKHPRVASAVCTGTPGWQLSFRVCPYQLSGFLVEVPPTLETWTVLFNSSTCHFGCIKANVNHPRSPRLIRSVWITVQFSNSFYHFPLPALIPDMLSDQWWNTEEFLVFKVSFLQTFHKQYS